jgi:D-methionine transport system ATP-binding protein
VAPLISFRGVSKAFPEGRGREVRAVDGVDLDVEDGEIIGVIGHSGAGKSTLVRMINALELPTEGTVTVGSRATGELGERGLRELRGEVAMIFQQFNLFSSRSVAGNVGYPLRIAGWSRERRRERVAELLEFVGIAEKARQFPNQLSGGQKQRVGIARALATSPRILLADEATSALDPETTKDVLGLLKRINRELGTTIVVITHEMDVVSSICDTVAVMERGRVIEHGPVYDVFSDPREPATRRFVHSVLHDRPLFGLLNVLVNIVRPIPFIIFITAIGPLTLVVMGTTIGTQSVLFPMSAMATFVIGRIVEQNLVSVDPGVIEAARAMGASRFRIIWSVLIPEALGPLILGYTFIFIGVVDMSAMAGYVGGGGLGDFAISYGYQQFNWTVTLVTVVIIVLIVQLAQLIGNWLARKALRR